MTYLVLKDLTPYAKDVIIVCASLTKDMNSKNNNYRANAIRALCCAVDDVRIEKNLIKKIQNNTNEFFINK